MLCYNKMSVQPNESTIWLASFDIGKKNFAFYIEEVNVNAFESIENIPRTCRYFKDGTCTTEFQQVIRDVSLNGRRILLENVDLTRDTDRKKYLDPKVFVRMTELLDSYRDYWQHCTSFIIEQQMSFGNKRNSMAVKLGQHCYSYFLIMFSTFKTPLEFPRFRARIGESPGLSEERRGRHSTLYRTLASFSQFN